ncbi:MAG: hypothetical protein ABWX67_04980 [Allosphingosinicella sp.]
MPRLLLPCSAAIVACNPPPKEAAMRNSSLVPETAAAEPRETKAEGPAPAPRADSPAEAQGRRTLSTAFVRVGPDGHLTVELRNGDAIVLRDIVMRPRDFCGVRALGASAGKRYCGGYGDVAAARAGGAPAPGAPDPAILPAKSE